MAFPGSIAKDLPPPDKLGKAPKRPMPGPDMESPEEDAMPGDDEEGEQAAAEASAMEEFDAAEGSADRAAALKRFIDICKPTY
jgi:hypothetical protein